MITDSQPQGLNAQLAELIRKAKERSPEIFATFEEEIRKLAESGILKGVLQVGVKAPEFELPEAKGGTLKLSSMLGQGPVVVTFYRGDWCPYCDLQLRAYQKALPEITKLGARLVAVSPQTPDNSLSTAEKKELAFPVLSDLHNSTARKYGLVFQISEVWKQILQSFGSTIPTVNGDDSWELPMPGTFVLDREGIVRFSHVNPDYRVRLETNDLLQAIERIKT